MLHDLQGDEGPSFRKGQLLKRMQYSGFGMQGFNFVIHFDTWPKMIRYGFVVFLAIDGYSRTMFCVQIASNNTALTALNAFMVGVEEYGLPDRTYSDYGGENRFIAKVMLLCRGLNRRSHMCGDSRRNTRVERHHKEIRRCVLEPYKMLFRHFEEDLFINYCDPNEKWLLHYMFLGRMQHELGMYTRATPT